jgi:hypothetical protein
MEVTLLLATETVSILYAGAPSHNTVATSDSSATAHLTVSSLSITLPINSTASSSQSASSSTRMAIRHESHRLELDTANPTRGS